MAQVALAWSLSKPFMTAPIVGTTSLEKLKDVVGTRKSFSPARYRWGNPLLFVGGIHVKLTEEETKSIDEPYRPKPVLGPR